MSHLDGYAIVYFDGSCGLCNRTVDFLMQRDAARGLRFSPLQGETARRHLVAADREAMETVVLTDGNHTYRYSAAVVRILRRLPAPWSWFGILLWIIPAPLRDIGYRFVAGHRHWFLPKKESCRLPTEDERAQLLP